MTPRTAGRLAWLYSVSGREKQLYAQFVLFFETILINFLTQGDISFPSHSEKTHIQSHVISSHAEMKKKNKKIMRDTMEEDTHYCFGQNAVDVAGSGGVRINSHPNQSENEGGESESDRMEFGVRIYV